VRLGVELSRIFAGSLRNWREVGGADAAIELVGRPEGSGAQAFFREKVLRLGNPGGPETRGELRRFLEFVLAADGRALVQARGFVPSDVPVEAALPPETAAR
jgi:ABC-type phosphate transport system substrate-binding protein